MVLLSNCIELFLLHKEGVQMGKSITGKNLTGELPGEYKRINLKAKLVRKWCADREAIPETLENTGKRK